MITEHNIDRQVEKKALLFRSGEWIEIDNPIFKESYFDMADSLEDGGYYEKEAAHTFGVSESSAVVYRAAPVGKRKPLYPYVVSFDLHYVLESVLVYVEDDFQLLRLLSVICPIITAGAITQDVMYLLENTVKKEKPDFDDFLPEVE